MAFVRKKSSSFKWPVTVEFPVDGGHFETETFDAIFRRVGRAEFTKLADQGDVELVERVLEGWEGIKDEEGKDIPYTKASLKDMLDDPYFARAIIKSYLESLEGAKAKN